MCFYLNIPKSKIVYHFKVVKNERFINPLFYLIIMRKLESLYRTMDDILVKDSLVAVSQLDKGEYSRGLYMVVGGIAAQSYLPTSCRRPTADLDMSIGRPLTHEEFKKFASPVMESLQDCGYACSTKKERRCYCVFVEQKEGGQESTSPFLIEFKRDNEHSFGNIETMLKREFDNSRMKRIEGGDAFYRVASPEDISVPKLVRTINSIRRNPNFLEEMYFFLSSLSDLEVENLLQSISERRENAVFNPGDIRLAEELRFASDLYDVRILSEMVGFNKPYFVLASQDWSTLGEADDTEKEIIWQLTDVKLGEL